ncbi:MAG: hypothetical protein Q7J21_02575 [Rugosibacter sp.]|nr:hypothetical protein [Rugosibacter sp.]
MKTTDYLDAAKKKLAIKSDYELAKKMNIPNGQLPGMRTEKRAVPLSVAYWLAITLEIDPAQVVADLEAQREKNPVRREFWKSFLSRAANIAILLASTLAFAFSAGLGNDQGGSGGLFKRRTRFA